MWSRMGRPGIEALELVARVSAIQEKKCPEQLAIPGIKIQRAQLPCSSFCEHISASYHGSLL